MESQEARHQKGYISEKVHHKKLPTHQEGQVVCENEFFGGSTTCFNALRKSLEAPGGAEQIADFSHSLDPTTSCVVPGPPGLEVVSMGSVDSQVAADVTGSNLYSAFQINRGGG